MTWDVDITGSALKDAGWFGKRVGRRLLRTAEKALGENPVQETKNLKTLRPNSFAQRELRIKGKYRVLFDVEPEAGRVVVLAVGEKRGETLLVLGKEFTEHHEDHPAE